MDHLVSILLILDAGEREIITWTPVMPHWRAVDCMRDWSHEEWYDGSPVGWDPCGVPDCDVRDHVLRVKRALIVEQAEVRA
jgi:hypothetical protein